MTNRKLHGTAKGPARKERERIVKYLRDISQAWVNVGERGKGALVYDIANDVERKMHHNSQEGRATK